METAVSIPTEIYQQAEALAQRLGISRNDLYVQALSQLLDTYRHDEVTLRLNAVYETQDSTLLPELVRMQNTALDQENW
jgi:metal-responsive CopG/Arc/MetJ family transcriptional regulator